VIEPELAFAHDHFFTSAASGNTELGKCTILLSNAKAVIYPLTILATVKDFIIHSKSKGINSTGMVIAAVVGMLLLLSLDFIFTCHLIGLRYNLFVSLSLGKTSHSDSIAFTASFPGYWDTGKIRLASTHYYKICMVDRAFMTL
jgi:hypothetical protein